MKSVVPLEVKPESQSLENELLCIFQPIGNIYIIYFLQKYRARMTIGTKVSANGIDPIWSWDCSSLLH